MGRVRAAARPHLSCQGPPWVGSSRRPPWARLPRSSLIPPQLTATSDRTRWTDRGRFDFSDDKKGRPSTLGPGSQLFRPIGSTKQMAPRCIAGPRSAGAASCPEPRDLLAPCQVRLGGTDHNSAKRSATSNRTQARPRGSNRAAAPPARSARDRAPWTLRQTRPRGPAPDVNGDSSGQHRPRC